MKKLALLIILFLLFGCIEQSEVLFPQQAKIKQVINADTTGQGAIDLSSYTFEPLQMKGNITLSKIMIVKAIGGNNPIFVNISTVNMSKGEIQEIRDLLTTFNSSRDSVVGGSPAESSCKRTLGIDKFDCTSRETCAKACYSTICAHAMHAFGYQFLDQMQAYTTATSTLDIDMGNAYQLLDQVEQTHDAKYANDLINTLEDVKVQVSAISENDIFNQNVYSVCEAIPFDTDSLNLAEQKVADKTGVQLVRSKPSHYEITTYLILTPPNTSGFVANEIQISERIPEQFSTDLNNISEVDPQFSEISQYNPLVLTWSFTDVGSGENQTKTIDYKVTTTTEVDRAFIEKNVYYPQVSVKRVDPTQTPVISEILGGSTYILSSINSVLGLYAAIGVFIAIVTIIVTRFIWNVVIAFVRINEVIRDRKYWQETVYQWAGYGRRNNLTYVAVGAVLVALSIYLIYMTPSNGNKLQEITVYGLGSFVSEEPLKGVGSVVLSMGLMSLYFVAEDFAKGMVLGKRYYLRPIDVLRARMGKLVERLAVLKDLVDSCEVLGMDVSTEEEVIDLVDMKEIEELLENEDNVREAKGVIERSGELIENSIDGLEEKKEILENWPLWHKHIKTELDERGSVNIDEVSEIPPKWRRWAMARYLEENAREVTLSGKNQMAKVITEVKSKPGLETVLEDLVKTNKIESCAILGRDGVVVASNISKEMRNVAGAMGARMFRSAEMVSNELHCGKVNRVVSESGEGKIVTIGNEKIILICLIKTDIDVGFVLLKMEEAIKKINEILA